MAALRFSSSDCEGLARLTAEQFDILRRPNPHLGFGGSGAHFCLGANLARLEIGLMFNAIADGMPSIRRAGDAERLRSGWLNGIKRLPVTYR